LCIGNDTGYWFKAYSVVASIRGAPQDEKAKAGRRKTPEEVEAATKAHEHDFDYLLGDWEFTAVSRNYGKSRGLWSAVRVPETGQIMDEFRVVSDTDDTLFILTTWRAYNAVSDRWDLVSVDDRGNGLQNIGTAHRDGPEIHLEQQFGSGTPSSWISRIRYYNIQPDRFSWNSDRSEDGGKTWMKDFQQLEAHRIGPSRVVSPLTSAKKASARNGNPAHAESRD
jgi:hypothetical protein